MYNHADNLDHVTWMIYTTMHTHTAWRLNMKFDFDWQISFNKENV